MSDIVIKAENLGKKYVIGHQAETGRSMTLREAITKHAQTVWDKTKDFIMGQPLIIGDTLEEVWALKDVSFEIRHGEAIGIVGRNGAGKSTLLKILSRITEPSTGRVKIKGRVASLLEVGTGFHPELTGRENIYLNGTILGMTRAEIKQKFDEIVAFAEIEKYLDTPVKRYSSGMYVRLAFAVAAHLEPEILVVDEVLAVGDAQFQKKCLGKMGDVSKAGRTVLFVSHQLDMIRSLCDKAILLDKGMISNYSDTSLVIDSYIKSLAVSGKKDSFTVPEDPSMPIQFIGGMVTGKNGRAHDHFDVFDTINFEFQYIVHRETEGLLLSFEIKRNGTSLFMSFDTDIDEKRLNVRKPGLHKNRIILPVPLLKSGFYTVTLRAGIINVYNCQVLEDVLCFNVNLISKPATFLSYAERRLGLIAMPIPWNPENGTNN